MQMLKFIITGGSIHITTSFTTSGRDAMSVTWAKLQEMKPPTKVGVRSSQC